jgi:uncharacterized protein (TIGR02117 family)
VKSAFLLCAALLCGCASVPRDAAIPDGEGRIYVVERGWHTDIGLSVDAVSGPLASLEGSIPGIRYMVFGFGERAFYMAHEENSFTMLGALLPSKSAILLTALRAPPDVAFADYEAAALRLPQSGVDRIADAIWQSLEKRNGVAIRLADGPYLGSVFYAGGETYDAFDTCNTWTARLLRDAGFPVETHVLFADQVMRQVLQIAARQRR